MQYFTVEQIGPKRSRTSHGFMLCHDVPIARTGLQLYGPGETPIEPGAADVVRIERIEDEVFHPDCIASLQGVPIVNEHPVDEFGERTDVTADNWRDLAIGHVLNPRRGEGIDDDVMLADLVFTDKHAIDLINAGKRELSVGYDADYEELGPGHGRQRNIRANHVALVERGRCGVRCSIGDDELVGLPKANFADCFCEPPEQPDTMEDGAMRSVKTTWADRIRAAFGARDQEELENALSEAPMPEGEPMPNGGGSGEHHVHVHLPGAGGEGPPDAGLVPASPAPATPSPLDQPGAPAGPAGGDIGQMLQQHIAQNNAEHEELWSAIESLAGGAGASTEAGGPEASVPEEGGGDSAYPHRDARRLADNQRSAEDNSRDELGGAPSGTSTEGKTVLSGFEMEAPPGTAQNDVARARDSALFEDTFSEAVALAEIIVPGISLPQFDRAAKPNTTVLAIRNFRARVLDEAWRDPNTREIIERLTGGRFVNGRQLGPELAKVVFRGVADAQARANTATMRAPGMFAGPQTVGPSPIQTNSDLQAVLDKYYADQRPRH